MDAKTNDLPVLLNRLAAKRVRLQLDGATLRVNGPIAELDAELRAELKQRKPELIAWLQDNQASDPAQSSAPATAPSAVADVGGASSGGGAPSEATIRHNAVMSPTGSRHKIPDRADGSRAPIMANQRRLLRLSQLRAADSLYTIPLAFVAPAGLDETRLKRTIQLLHDRHEALRMAFPGWDDRPVLSKTGIPGQLEEPQHAVIHPVGTPVEWRVEDCDAETAESRLRALLCLPFQLATGPLWRTILVRGDSGRRLLGFAFHHVIFDGLSRAVFLRDLFTLYAIQETPAGWASLPPPRQFGDYTAWATAPAQSPRRERDRIYWEQRFSRPVAPLRLPADRDPSIGSSSGMGQSASNRTTGGNDCVATDPRAELGRRIIEAARGWRVSPAAILLSAVAATLYRYTGQTELLTCVPLANRDMAGFEDTIGFFNTAAPVLIAVRPEQSGRRLVDEVHRQLLEAATHPWIELDQIICLPSLSRTPLNRLLFSYQEAKDSGWRLAGEQVALCPLRKDAADFCLAFQFESGPDGLGTILEFDSSRFSSHSATALGQRVELAIETLVERSEKSLDSWPAWGDSALSLGALLETCPGIAEAAVTIDSASGAARAWLVLDEHHDVSLEQVRRWLSDRLPVWRLPEAIMPLDQLPRDESGQVDVKALVEQAAARRHSDRSDAARVSPPRTDLERLVADTWQETLWIEHPIGVDERFEDLGGHSLLAVRMLRRLEQSLGHPVPAEALRRLTTVAEFAAAIESAAIESAAIESAGQPAAERPAAGQPASERRKHLESERMPSAEVLRGLRTYVGSWVGWRRHPDSLLVGLHTDGVRPPLFWCLQNQFELQQLARYLGPDQPVYGMRSGNYVMVKDQANIDRLGAYYAEEIRQLRLAGPLLVGGNCQAAQIAFQVAVELRRSGYEVPLLYLHEKFVPSPYDGRIALTFGRQSDRNPYLSDPEPEREFGRFYTGPFTVDLVRGSHGRFFKEPNVQDFTRVIRTRRDECFLARPSKEGDFHACPQSGTNGSPPPPPARAGSSMPTCTWTAPERSTTATWPETGIEFWRTFTSLFTRNTR